MDEDGSISKSSIPNTSTDKTSNQQKKRRDDPVLSWLKDYGQRKILKQKTKQKQRKEMHDEKVKLFKRLASTLERK